jgi:hypothetical protein
MNCEGLNKGSGNGSAAVICSELCENATNEERRLRYYHTVIYCVSAGYPNAPILDSKSSWKPTKQFLPSFRSPDKNFTVSSCPLSYLRTQDDV